MGGNRRQAEGDIALETLSSPKKTKKQREADQLEAEATRLMLMEEEFMRTGKKPTLPTISVEAPEEAAS